MFPSPAVPDVVIHELASDHVVIELHERLTAPAPALELHLVRDPETGASVAWWESEFGMVLRPVAVGAA